MRNRVYALLALLVLAGAGPLMAACNTTAGAGRDGPAAGEAVEDSDRENGGY